MAPPAEISIPSTIISNADGKPFTLYNITLRLPLRSFVVQKRYSDFATLHATLQHLVGAPPPEPLPAKSWFRSTVASAEMTENRRRGLETYLRAIAESPDRRWRDTPAWRAFLNLPSSTSNSAASAHGLVSGGGLAGIDPTTWLDVHREMKGCLHEARLALARRDGALDGNNSTAALEAGAAAKKALVRAGTLLVSLTDGLRQMQEAGRLGDGELRRRRDLVAAAKVEREGLDKISNSMTSNTRGNSNSSPGVSSFMTQGSQASDKTSLFGGASAARMGGRVLGGPAPETERTRELDNQGVLQLQKQQMAEQDQAVAQLGAIVRRQKEMGLMIRDEVDAHNEMLDRVSEDADRVHGKIKVAKNRVKKL